MSYFKESKGKKRHAGKLLEVVCCSPGSLSLLFQTFTGLPLGVRFSQFARFTCDSISQVTATTSGGVAPRDTQLWAVKPLEKVLNWCKNH